MSLFEFVVFVLVYLCVVVCMALNTVEYNLLLLIHIDLFLSNAVMNLCLPPKITKMNKPVTITTQHQQSLT